jgi:prepilin-type N-terminal cleavage/methylation domain-containing protein
MRNHRGFTLVELLIVLLLMTIVTGGIYRLLNGTQRLTRAQTERIDLQSNVRTASIVIPSELREINTVTGAATSTRTDILAGDATSITYRAMRAFGLLCGGSTQTSLRIINSSLVGLRTAIATPRDSIYVFNEGASSDFASDDSWESGRITAVGAGTCSTGEAATILTINPALTTAASALVAGTPVRTFEVMKLGLYVSGGQSWLGMQNVSAGSNMEPLLGPLQANSGVQFTYLDAAGTGTTAPNATQLAATKSIVVTINGVTSQVVSTGGGNANQGYLYDQLTSQISLRNALR